MMKNRVTGWRSWMAVLVASCVLAGAAPLRAQEHEHKQAGKEKRHEEMRAMHQEMEKKLHEQLTALREHAKKMEGVTDEKALLTELKKHQQMTDDFLGSMMEFHEKMRERMKEHYEHMKEHREHMHSQMQKGAGESKPEGGGATETPATKGE